jgi:hypothetical protein
MKDDLRCNDGLEILCHFAIGDGRQLPAARNIHQAADLSAADWVKQDRRRVCQDDVAVVRVGKLALVQDQPNGTRWDLNLLAFKIMHMTWTW